MIIIAAMIVVAVRGVEKLKLAQNEKNRSLLKVRMVQLKKQISDFRNPYRSLNSIYAQKSSSSGTRIQIEV